MLPTRGQGLSGCTLGSPFSMPTDPQFECLLLLLLLTYSVPNKSAQNTVFTTVPLNCSSGLRHDHFPFYPLLSSLICAHSRRRVLELPLQGSHHTLGAKGKWSWPNRADARATDEQFRGTIHSDKNFSLFTVLQFHGRGAAIARHFFPKGNARSRTLAAPYGRPLCFP
jgi:hypothetical protein